MQHLIVGDIHLGKSTSIGKPGVGKELNSRIRDRLDLLDWVLEQAISLEPPHHIILVGDIYEEPRPHPTLINYFMGWLKKCEKQNVCVDIIAGNHDTLRTGVYTLSALDLITVVEFPHATVYKTPTIKDFDGIRFAFIPFRDKRMYEADSTEAALDKMKDELSELHPRKKAFNVAVGHLALQGALDLTDEITDSLNELMVPISHFKGWDAVLMGHIHHPQILNEKPLVAHVGSLDRSDFHVSETDVDKVVYIVGDGQISVLPVPTRNLCRIDIEVPSGRDSTKFVTEAITLYNKTKSIKESIVRVDIVLNGEVANVDREKIYSLIYDTFGAHYICGFFETRNISVIDLSQEQVIDESMSATVTIEKFADAKTDFDDESERMRFKEIALECNRQYEDSLKSEVN